MSEFKGFTFEKPIKDQNESQDDHLTELSMKFNRISTDDHGSRLGSFKSFRSPIAGRSRSEAQEKRRLEALELQKQVRMGSCVGISCAVYLLNMLGSKDRHPSIRLDRLH